MGCFSGISAYPEQIIIPDKFRCSPDTVRKKGGRDSDGAKRRWTWHGAKRTKAHHIDSSLAFSKAQCYEFI